ncbi:MAG: hypothetical protein PHQ27_10375 [Victivallales bacterium]|nr:hypothetical protein [Victivallales bacterium]
MPRPRPKSFIPVDYSRRGTDRKRLARYLRSTRPRKATAQNRYRHAVRRNRIILTVIVLTIVTIGMVYVWN